MDSEDFLFLSGESIPLLTKNEKVVKSHFEHTLVNKLAKKRIFPFFSVKSVLLEKPEPTSYSPPTSRF